MGDILWMKLLKIDLTIRAMKVLGIADHPYLVQVRANRDQILLQIKNLTDEGALSHSLEGKRNGIGERNL
jgi:hypothetical protein